MRLRHSIALALLLLTARPLLGQYRVATPWYAPTDRAAMSAPAIARQETGRCPGWRAVIVGISTIGGAFAGAVAYSVLGAVTPVDEQRRQRPAWIAAGATMGLALGLIRAPGVRCRSARADRGPARP